MPVGTEGQHEYSISELAEAAGVSTRTIRYYVSEGLLPPPVGSGTRTSTAASSGSSAA